jgi:hypothetical protein
VADSLATVRAPAGPVYRVGRSPDPFAPPDWIYAQSDGTFGGRFDDVAGRRDDSPGRGFRTLYFATTVTGAFGEMLSRFRPDLAVLAALGRSASATSVVHADWAIVRRVGVTVLDPHASFVDIGDARTLMVLRRVLAPAARALSLPDVDLSAVTGPARALTQAAARHIYEEHDSAGLPCYAGIRYTSRLDRAWECWAVFSDRLRHRVVRVDAITAHGTALVEAAGVLGLRV